jgi:hypothetical protein
VNEQVGDHDCQNDGEHDGTSYERCPCHPLGLQRLRFLRDAPPEIRREMRHRLACHERFDAAIYELTHRARVIQRRAARITFRSMSEQLAFGAKLAKRCVG